MILLETLNYSTLGFGFNLIPFGFDLSYVMALDDFDPHSDMLKFSIKWFFLKILLTFKSCFIK